jgi:hypothetical protein
MSTRRLRWVEAQHQQVVTCEVGPADNQYNTTISFSPTGKQNLTDLYQIFTFKIQNRPFSGETNMRGNLKIQCCQHQSPPLDKIQLTSTLALQLPSSSVFPCIFQEFYLLKYYINFLFLPTKLHIKPILP